MNLFNQEPYNSILNQTHIGFCSNMNNSNNKNSISSITNIISRFKGLVRVECLGQQRWKVGVRRIDGDSAAATAAIAMSRITFSIISAPTPF